MVSSRKVAIVTGAGSGIGKAVSLALMREGYSVVLAGRRTDALEAVANEGRRQGAKALAVPTDVGDAAQVEKLFAKTRETFTRLDLLFNNAGIGAPAVPMETLDVDTWKRVVDTNLTGSFLCAREAIKIMQSQSPKGGRIINNGSISAHVPRPNSVAYTSTKHAITGLTKSIALDGRRHSIACGQIDVGNVLTELSAPMVQGVMQASGHVMSEPLMDVENVAKAVLYMASLPLDANVLFLTVMATNMPFVGRG